MPATTTPVAATTLPVARSRDAACPGVGRREGRSARRAGCEAATAGTYCRAGREIATAATDPCAAEVAAAHAGAATTEVCPAATATEVCPAATAAKVCAATAAAKVCAASNRCGPTLGKARRRQRDNQCHCRSRAQDFQTFHDQNSFSRKQTP